MLAQGRHVYKFGLGQSPFPVPASVVSSLRRHAAEKDYLPVKGLQALRDEVAAYMRKRQGIDVSGDDVLVGPGSKELLFLSQMVHHGDLIIPVPSWVSYAPQAYILGREVQWIPSEGRQWSLFPRELENACKGDSTRPRLLILNYPSNPTGQTFGEQQLQDLATLCRRHNIIVVSDEIYGELHHDGLHKSLARYYPEGTVVSTGLSKWCGAGGWRLGVYVFPKQLRWMLDAMAAVASETFTSTAAPIQYAAVEAFKWTAEIQSYVRNQQRILKPLAARLVSILEHGRVSCSTPQGAFYLFLDFSAHADRLKSKHGIVTSAELTAKVLEETGVAFLPGSDFGAQPHDLVARIAFVNFDGEAALKAVDQLPPDALLDNAFLAQHCGQTLKAAELIAKFVTDL